MYKKILAILAVSTLAFSSYLSAAVIDSNLRFDFGNDTGWGEFAAFAFPEEYESGLFPVMLPSAGESTEGFFAHVDGSLFLTPASLEALPPTGLPLIGEAFVGSSVTDGRNTVGITVHNMLLLPPVSTTTGLTINDTNYDGVLENTHQLVIIEREDLGAQNYDVEFRYDQIEWFANTNPFIPEGLTFNPEGGIEYFEMRSGVISQVELDSGNGGELDEPSPGVGELDEPSLGDGELDEPSPGDGELDEPSPGEGEELDLDSSGSGTTADPFMPIVFEDDLGSTEWDFLFTADADTFYAIDPDVAVGYEYQVNSGPLFSEVKLPSGFDNDLFDISIWDDINANWELVESDWLAGQIFSFTDPVNRFRVTGIDVSNNLDPTSPTAFITEIAFDSSGQIDMSQTAITQFVPDTLNANQVSAPGTLVLFIGTLGFLVLRRQRALRCLA